jgi:hypothetical protein
MTKINWLTLFKEILIFYTENHTKCRVTLLTVKEVVMYNCYSASKGLITTQLKFRLTTKITYFQVLELSHRCVFLTYVVTFAQHCYNFYTVMMLSTLISQWNFLHTKCNDYTLAFWDYIMAFHETSRSGGKHYCVVLERSWFEIWARRLTVLTKISRGFSQYLEADGRIVQGIYQIGQR